GQPLDIAAEAEHHGSAGDIIISPQLASCCRLDGVSLAGGFVRLNMESPPPEYDIQTPSGEINPQWAEMARTFIDPAIHRRLDLGLDTVGEIRRVSVIFMSFSGLDYDEDSQVGEKLEKVYDWVANTVALYGGSINKVDMGDKGSKFLITFGTPTAHENDEELATLCGLQLVSGQENLSEMGIEQRIGIATSVVFAGEVGAPSRQEYTVMGRGVNLAARLMAHSRPGQLLIGPLTHQRIASKFEFAPPEKVQFKGIPQPLSIYQVLGIKSAEQPGLTQERKSLIGRREELAAVEEVLVETLYGQLRTLIIRGEAGLGKTRLAQEILDLALQRDFRAAGGEALSYAKRSPYLVFISILRRLMGISLTTGVEDAIAKLDSIVRQTDPQHPYRLPIIANMLGLECPDNETTRYFDAQLRQENLFDFLVIYFRYLATEQPLLLFFEDAQWIDRNSLELIAYLMRNLVSYPVLFCIVRRSYSRSFVCPQIAEIESNPITLDLQLREFNRQETEAFVLQQLNIASMDADLMDFIYDSSHGNASFTEQLIHNLKSLNKISLQPSETGDSLHAAKNGDLAEIQVPDSLSSLIMSQLDRLSPQVKLTLTVAAVVGRRFAQEIVVGSYPVQSDETVIAESVEELKNLDLVNETKDDDFYNYIFKNLLTRDVAYDSLLFAHRREYHRRVGLCLEGLHEHSLKEWYDELARHFYQSEDDERAGKYLNLAGDKAYDLYANAPAEDYYTKGLERTPGAKNPSLRYRLLTMRAKVFSIIGKTDLQKQDLDEALLLTDLRNDLKGKVNTLDTITHYYSRVNRFDEMRQTIEKAEEILNQIDYPFGRINIERKLGTWYFAQHRNKEALECWLKCNEDAEKAGDVRGLSSTLTNCGLAYKGLGDLDKALEYYNQSTALDRETGNKRSEALNLGNIGRLHHQRGDFDKALDFYQQAIEIGRSIGSKQIQSLYIGNLAMIYQAKGERRRALDSHQELLSISRQMGYPRGQINSLGNIGVWWYEEGEYEQAVAHYEQALEILRKVGLKGEEPNWMLNIGLTRHYQGLLEEAEKTLTEAVNKALEVGNKPAVDYARRYLGFVLMDKGEVERARVEFEQALEMASSLGSKIGLASAKIGLGWVKALAGEGVELIQEGIDAASKIGDTETFIKGKTTLGRIYASRPETLDQAVSLFEEALAAARAKGYRCEILFIEPLLNQVKTT
ncbi:MAG: tetratricopeptide repeat protein, partial [Calditrichota bacterium]